MLAFCMRFVCAHTNAVVHAKINLRKLILGDLVALLLPEAIAPEQLLLDLALDYCIRMRFVLDSYAIRMRVYAQMCAA